MSGCRRKGGSHGTAHDIAGKGIANPTGLMPSATMLLDHLQQTDAANKLRRGFRAAPVNEEIRTGDRGQANTQRFTDVVCRDVDMSSDESGAIRAMG